jgi:hypothetical protein
MFSTKESVLTFFKREITETDLEGQAATARDAHNLTVNSKQSHNKSFN